MSQDVDPPRPCRGCPRICCSSASAVIRRSSGSVIEYHGTAMPFSSIVTRPPPWSRTRPMNVAQLRKSCIDCLCAAAVVNGTAEAPRPVVYCTPSIRKP
jgi:hypothetical protein